jgi:carbonic anhydrase
MGAVMDPDSAASLEHVCNWIGHATPALTEGTDLETLIRDNVRLQIANLRTYDFIREAEADGRLTLHGWVYRFETGDVDQLNPETGAFERLGTEP